MRAAVDSQDKYKVKNNYSILFCFCVCFCELFQPFYFLIVFFFVLLLSIFCVVFCFGLLLFNPSFVAQIKCLLHYTSTNFIKDILYLVLFLLVFLWFFVCFMVSVLLEAS